jgi:hypothetical protein
MNIRNRRALKKRPKVSQETQGNVDGWTRAYETKNGLAPEDSINFNSYDSEENDPSNW